MSRGSASDAFASYQLFFISTLFFVLFVILSLRCLVSCQPQHRNRSSVRDAGSATQTPLNAVGITTPLALTGWRMAHVLLPSDLPFWGEVKKQLAKIRTGGEETAKIMAQIHEVTSVSLDPEDSHPVLDHPGFKVLETFLKEEKLPGKVFLDLADWASRLPTLKPGNGMHYSLRTEEAVFTLNRTFVISLLANAFFSTFPRRKSKTHPTLLDFNMADFFLHLHKDSHRRKVKAFLRYFEGLEPEPDGVIQFTRKLFRGPSLPGWLCSERPLVPLLVRPQGTFQEAESWVFRGCPCASIVGGDVLKESTSQESELFFDFPELLVTLCFVEGLVEEEGLIVEGVRAPDTQEVNFCFLDNANCGRFEDRDLLLSLNKAVAAFAHEPRFVDRRRTPDGGESSEEGQRSTESMEERFCYMLGERVMCPPGILSTSQRLSKSLSQASSKFSMRTASESSVRLEEDYVTADDESEKESNGQSSEAVPLSYPHRPPSSQCSHRSIGFVLAHSEEDEDSMLQNEHERLDDFRRRIRRRTRRKVSRKSSSYSSGGSSSEMEDISEDPEDFVKPPITIRPACSEPSLVNLENAVPEIPSFISPEVLLSPTGQKQVAASCSGGHFKAYSHDGVRPNLPVPFRARFRDKRKISSRSQDLDKSYSISGTDDKEYSRCPVATTSGGDSEDWQLRALILWLAASMAQLPALIIYTANAPELREVVQVYNQVLKRQWTIGDLACEVLRFCRNRNAPGHRTGKHNHLFGQLLADKNSDKQKQRKLYSEESVD